MSYGVSDIYLGTKTQRVYHSSDGTLSNVTISAVWPIRATISGTYRADISCSFGTGEIDRIPRQANIVSAPNFNDEQNPTITFNNNGGFSLNARMEFNSKVIQRSNISNTGSCQFILTDTERDLLRSSCINSNSLGVRFVIATILNGNETWWSYLDKTMTIVNGNPTFNNFDYYDTNENIISITGDKKAIVKGKSLIAIEINDTDKMIANKKATSSKYVIECDNYSNTINYSTDKIVDNIGILNSSGLIRCNVRAYDSRNNSTLVYKDIKVYDYDNPISNSSIVRLNNFENQTTLSIKGSYSPIIINGQAKNDILSVMYRYKELNGNWREWKSVSFQKTDDFKILCDDIILDLDNAKSFLFEVKIEDKISNIIQNLQVDIGQAIFFISNNKQACYINGQEILTYEVIDEW